MLRLIKKPILILLLIGALLGGGYYFTKKPSLVLGQSTANLRQYLERNYPRVNNFVQQLPFANQVFSEQNLEENVESESQSRPISGSFFQDSLNQTTKQLGTLSENGSVVKDQLLKFASEIKESSQSTPLHEKAFEYGQYLYCQQVVKEYENSPE